MRLGVYVQPGASRTSVGGSFDGELMVRVQSRPVDGAATNSVRDALAVAFGLKARQVTLVRVATSRHKAFDLDGDEATLTRRLAELLEA